MKQRLLASSGLLLAVIVAVGIGMQLDNMLLIGIIAIIAGVIAGLVLSRFENSTPIDYPSKPKPPTDADTL